MSSRARDRQRAAGEDAPLSKDELLERVHWAKQGVAVAVGVLMGVVGLQGLPAMIIFAAVCAGTGVAYPRLAGIPDDPSQDISSELLSEGMMPAAGLFFISWILAFNAIHV
eukprot:TRINITY_DN985_c0_g1_i2.p3 TRINITY_DN985_c0_g1~~TRINITY_DN985_c0_g1_i2.p3  ORF type:complete len:111 (-),score=24.13 TRINITY_DN985_c0_g1_i2:298-630(-)